MAVKPVWRIFEDASIEERCEILDYELLYKINTLYDAHSGTSIKKEEEIENEKKHSIIVSERFKKALMNELKTSKLPQANILGFYIKSLPAFYQSFPLTKIILMYKAVITLYNASFRTEARKEAYLDNKNKLKRIKIVRSDVTKKSVYRNLVSSFYSSEEWNRFRASWLQKYPLCHRCGKTKETMQVHHRIGYNLSRTIIEEGFLEGLKHPERFWTLCRRCHSILGGFLQEEKPLIHGTIIRDNYLRMLLTKMLKKKIMFEEEREGHISNLVEIANWNTKLAYEIEIAQKFIKIKLWLHDRNQDENKRIFDIIKSYKKHIELNLGNELIWKRMDEFRLSLIEFYISENIGWASSVDELYNIQDEIVDKSKQFEKILKSFKDEFNMHPSLFKRNSEEVKTFF